MKSLWNPKRLLSLPVMNLFWLLTDTFNECKARFTWTDVSLGRFLKFGFVVPSVDFAGVFVLLFLMTEVLELPYDGTSCLF